MFLKIYPFTLVFYHVCQYDEEHKNIPTILQHTADKNKKPHTFVFPYDMLKLIVSFTSFCLVSELFLTVSYFPIAI